MLLKVEFLLENFKEDIKNAHGTLCLVLPGACNVEEKTPIPLVLFIFCTIVYHHQFNVEIFFVPSHFLRQDEKISRDFEVLR